MGLRDILVFINSASVGQKRFELAKAIANDHNASLSAVFVGRKKEIGFGLSAARLPEQPVLSHLSIGDLAVPPEILEPMLLDRIACEETGGDCYSIEPIEMTSLIELAKATDLAIVGQADPGAREPRTWHPEEIVLACGRPVLMVPYAGTFQQIGHRVLIAWDGSREAVRALNDAIPLMRSAEQIIILTVGSRARALEKIRPLTERLVTHLARHGIYAEVEETQNYGNPTSSVLLSKSVDFASDLLVAGAYHHSPLREALMGGVSRDLFQQMTIPGTDVALNVAPTDTRTSSVYSSARLYRGSPLPSKYPIGRAPVFDTATNRSILPLSICSCS